MQAWMWKILKNVMHCLDPETAHRLSLAILSTKQNATIASADPMLSQKVFGITFPNILGLAAGLDKNAIAMPAFFNMGFGFIEVGTVTVKPQIGNLRPRIFRLREDYALINRLGFNNDGLDSILERIQNKPPGIVGVNIGKNKTGDIIGDYRALLQAFDCVADYITINISSPNTPALREQQTNKNLKKFLGGVFASDRVLQIPVLLKISPDILESDLYSLLRVVPEFPISALVVSNTTTDRIHLYSEQKVQEGGLSGRPLFKKSTELLRFIYKETSLPLIGVGGIESADTCYQKIKAGAQLVQLYTALIYHGPICIQNILKGVKTLLKRDGFSHISEAVGADAK